MNTGLVVARHTTHEWWLGGCGLRCRTHPTAIVGIKWRKPTVIAFWLIALLVVGGCANRDKPRPLPQAGVITAAAFVDEQNGWLAMGNTLLKTANGGKTWTKIHVAPGDVQSIDLLTAKKGWIATSDALYATRNGGSTWRKILAENMLGGRVRFVDAKTGWVTTDRRILVTRDGGVSWEPARTPCPLGIHSLINAQTGWILCSAPSGGAGIEQKRLFRTDDGGRTWRLIAETSPLGEPEGSIPFSSYSSDLFFLDEQNGWLSTTRGEILFTSDGGRSWTRLANLGDLSELRDLKFFSGKTGLVILTERTKEFSSLMETSDGGRSWMERYPRLPSSR